MNAYKQILMVLFAGALLQNILCSSGSSSSTNSSATASASDWIALESALLRAEQLYLGLGVSQNMKEAENALIEMIRLKFIPDASTDDDVMDTNDVALNLAELVAKALVAKAKEQKYSSETALAYYTNLVEKGTPWQKARANQILGSMYHHGQGGVARDITQAGKYYALAAEQDVNKIAQAKAYLGLSALFDAATDVTEAQKYVKYIERAADRSEDNLVRMTTRAQLGRMYYFGQGVPQNEGMAIEYLREPMSQNELSAKLNALAIMARIYPEDTSHHHHHHHRLSNFLSQLIGLRSPESLHDEGYILKYGVIFPEADVFLGRLYYEGKCVTQNDATAIDFLKRVADSWPENARAAAEASILLAKMYLKPSMRNYDQAHLYLQNASKQSVDPASQIEAYAYLGHIYFRGYGVAKNNKEALYYWTMVIDNCDKGEDWRKILDRLYLAAMQNKFLNSEMEAMEMLENLAKTVQRKNAALKAQKYFEQIRDIREARSEVLGRALSKKVRSGEGRAPSRSSRSTVSHSSSYLTDLTGAPKSTPDTTQSRPKLRIMIKK